MVNKLEWLYDSDAHSILKSLHSANTLAINLPEVEALYRVPQVEKHHPEIDTGIHLELSLEQASQLTADPAVKYAVLVHDLGKGVTPVEVLPQHIGHETTGAKLALKVGKRCGVPTEWLLLGFVVAKYHTHCHTLLGMTPKAVARFVLKSGLAKRPWLAESFALACEADSRGRTGFEDRAYPQGPILVELAHTLSFNLHLLDQPEGWAKFVDVARKALGNIKNQQETL